jgi:uncharacterized protein
MTIKDAIAASRRRDYADAIRLFRPLADQGDAHAQYGLARIYLDHGEYFENKDVPLNDDNEIQAFNDRWDEGLRWLCLASDQGLAGAQCRLGQIYIRGDYAEGTRLLRLAADQGHAGAQWTLGLAFAGNISCSQRQNWQRGDAEAVKWFRLAANQGHLEAQHKVGIMYLNGSDGLHEKDLGYIYLKDQSAPQDNAEAAKWLRLVAEQGHLAEPGLARDAQYKLGCIYLHGPDEPWEEYGHIYLNRDVPKDYAEAAKWLRLAAEQGHEEAQYKLGCIPNDYAEAAAEPGRTEAQYKLGFIYLNGPDKSWEEYGHNYLNKDVPQDYAEAARWLFLAADQGHAKAQCKLGFMYHEGQGVPQDHVRAHMWLTLSALRGEPDAVIGRFTVARCMTPAQFAEAKKLAREWKPSK